MEPEELAEHAGKQKVLIGKGVSEHLDVVPAKFCVMITRRPKYAFENEDSVIQVPASARIIEGGIPTESLLAQIAISKHATNQASGRRTSALATRSNSTASR